MKKKEFLENKKGLPGCKVNEEVNRLGLNKKPSKRKSDRNIDRSINSVNIHRYNIIKKQ